MQISIFSKSKFSIFNIIDSKISKPWNHLVLVVRTDLVIDSRVCLCNLSEVLLCLTSMYQQSPDGVDTVFAIT